VWYNARERVNRHSYTVYIGEAMAITATNREMRYAFLRDADIELDRTISTLKNARSMASRAGDTRIFDHIDTLIRGVKLVQSEIQES
jgi:hypothetical protein